MNIVQSSNENIDKLCPVPLKQQPIREYCRLRQRRFFRWAILTRSKYTTKLMAVWISASLFALFVFNLRSSVQSTVQSQVLSYAELFASGVVAELIVLFALIRLYSAWQYVYLRLISRQIDYKTLETKEYECWQKPELALAQDLLVARFQVRPILKRLKQSMALVAIIVSFNFLILFLTTNY